MGGFQSIVQDPVQPAEFSCEECTQKLEHLLAETFVALHGKCLPAHVGIKAPMLTLTAQMRTTAPV